MRRPSLSSRARYVTSNFTYSHVTSGRELTSLSQIAPPPRGCQGVSSAFTQACPTVPAQVTITQGQPLAPLEGREPARPLDSVRGGRGEATSSARPVRCGTGGPAGGLASGRTGEGQEGTLGPPGIITQTTSCPVFPAQPLPVDCLPSGGHSGDKGQHPVCGPSVGTGLPSLGRHARS